MAKTKTWQDKATATAIQKKISRKTNPATSFTKLAMEFGAPVYDPYYGHSPAPAKSFITHVRNTLGKTEVFA